MKGAKPGGQTCAATVNIMSQQQIEDIHVKSRYPGIKRSLYFVRGINSVVAKAEIKRHQKLRYVSRLTQYQCDGKKDDLKQVMHGKGLKWISLIMVATTFLLSSTVDPPFCDLVTTGMARLDKGSSRAIFHLL